MEVPTQVVTLSNQLVQFARRVRNQPGTNPVFGVRNAVLEDVDWFAEPCRPLGVVFGDVLASELPLRWVMVTDEYGTAPTLRFKQTTVQVNALTTISKRIERDEPVNLSLLLRQTREQLRQKYS